MTVVLARVTPAVAGLLGLRITASDHLPRNMNVPSGNVVGGFPPTVAGAAAALCRRARTAFPFDPLREPPPPIVSPDHDRVKVGNVRC